MLIPFTGCAKKVDPKRSIEKIQKEVVAMPLAELQSHASAYAAAIRAKKAEIQKIQQEIQHMPMNKFFDNKSMMRHVVEIGQEGEALFERYRIYAQAFQEKGGDFTKIQIELSQPK
jgi:ribosome-binding ATPase YchF (GTP1/OBG family)